MLVAVGALPDEALAAVALFHAATLPPIRALLAEGEPVLTLAFATADYRHEGWRLAVVQELAREYAPQRINAIAGGDPAALARAATWLDKAEGVTGQTLLLDGTGAGPVLF